MKLHNDFVYPVADVLTARGIPYAFITGVPARLLPKSYAGRPVLEKPFVPEQLRALVDQLVPVPRRR